MRVTYFHRLPARANQQSVEHYFAAVRSHLPVDVQWTVQKSPFDSRGIAPRLGNLAQASWHRRDGDISHVTGDVNYLVLALDGRRTVLTILDCGFEQLPPGRRRDVIQHLWYTLPVARAGHITAISEFTRQRLLALTGCDPRKIRVIPVCISPDFQRAAPRPPADPPVVLLIGTAPNKNIARVAQALAGVRCTVRIIGQPTAIQRQALMDAGVTFTSAGGLSQPQVVEEYRRCDLLLFASTYEGFGMPILEAQAIGRPVVTSTAAAMPDVAGGAAALVDPFDPLSIRAGVTRVLASAGLREALIARGFANLPRFAPAQVAQAYAALYRELRTLRIP